MLAGLLLESFFITFEYRCNKQIGDRISVCSPKAGSPSNTGPQQDANKRD